MPKLIIYGLPRHFVTRNDDCFYVITSVSEVIQFPQIDKKQIQYDKIHYLWIATPLRGSQ